MRKLWAEIDRFLMERKWSIKDKLTYAVLLHSLGMLLIFGGLISYGLIGMKNMVDEMRIDLVKEFYRDSSELLLDERKEELLFDAQDKAEDIDHRLNDMEREVRRIAQAMENIECHPELYQPQYVGLPEEPDPSGEVPFYLQYGPDVSPEEFAYGIGMAANMEDILTGIADDSPFMICSFVASRHNYCLSANNRLMPEHETPVYYDVVSTEWYQEAVKRNGIFFSEIKSMVRDAREGTFFCVMPYHDAEGNIAGVAGAQATTGNFRRLMQEVSHWYTDGFGFVLDGRGQMILYSDDESLVHEMSRHMGGGLQDPEHAAISDMARAMTAGEQGVSAIMLNGEKYYVGYTPMQHNGWSMGLAMAESEVFAPVVRNQENFMRHAAKYTAASEQIERQMAIFFLIVCAVLIFLVIKFGKMMAEHFVKPINELSDGVRTIAAGNLEKKLDIHTGDEIEHLAARFNAMTDELKEYMKNVARAAAERERISAELSMATEIQRSTLPRIFPPFPEHDEFDIYASIKTAREVGGDFYDFCLPDEDHLFFTVADVSGKGMAAALFMVISKTVLKNFVRSMGEDHDLVSVLSHTNDRLCMENDAEMFVTAFAGLLELSTGRLTYVNAGHNPPLLCRAGEKDFRYLDMERNFVLGGMEKFEYRSGELTLVPGDRLFLYTDGLTEARDESRKLYGKQRLRDTLNRKKMDGIAPEGLISYVWESLEKYVGMAERSDDITMMALSYHGRKEEKENRAYHGN